MLLRPLAAAAAVLEQATLLSSSSLATLMP